MALDIALKIYIPEKLVLERQVHRVVLPNDGKTLTVIKDRAPTLLSLDMGMVQILAEDDKPEEIFYISGGAADIKEDVCTVLTEAVFSRNDLSLEKAKTLYEEFNNPFYKWLVEIFEQEENSKKFK